MLVSRQQQNLARMQYVVTGRVGNIDIDVDIIDDTFDVSISISTILLMYRYQYRRYFRIKVSIAVSMILCWLFLSTLHRYFSTDMQNDAHNYLSFRAFVSVQRSVEILDERRITCNKI